VECWCDPGGHPS